VGGDYYDVLELDGKGLAVVVGDVTGKGLPAAMLMASVLGSARALFSAGLRGRDLIAALNKHVCTNAAGGRFVTLFYGELDTATGELTYVNAGHNPPILARADGSVERLEPTTMVLGVMPDVPVEAGRAELGPADRLLIFTDGYSEAWNKKEEEYGEGRLAESLVRAQALTPPAAVEQVTADVLAFCGSTPPHDDMTLMLVARQAS
jgi:sigma-B regulation protein RsbU (phosphoserine phosphatase)